MNQGDAGTEFFPKGYEVPVQAGNYMKFEDGENTFRVLGKAVVGYEFWNVEGKPVRVAKDKLDTINQNDIRRDPVSGNPEKVKHFWAFPVWNYEAKRLQILQITQSTIMTAIKALVDNAKWGAPQGYDITVTKTGQKLTTEYAVMPNPHAPVPEEAQKALKATHIELERLFTGDNPFVVEATEAGAAA